MTTQPRLLSDGQMQNFIINGYLSVQTDFPPQFHEDICRQATSIFETTGNPQNEIYPKISKLGSIFAHPAVHGALTSILGPNYIMHPHRHCHLTPPGKAPQSYHKDSYEEDENVHHHRARWAMAFYYPQDVPLELGPTAVRPATQYYNSQTQAEAHDETLLVGNAGTVTIVHYDLWHRASANLSDHKRFMMKFLFCRMEEPETPSWQSVNAPWPPAAVDSPSIRQHAKLWQKMWNWHRGSHYVQEMPPADQGLIRHWVQALQSFSEAERIDAAYTLAEVGASAVPALMEALHTEAAVMCSTNLQADHTNPSELYAGYALSAVGAPAVPTLIDALTSRDWWIRASAADILGDMGHTAAPAAPALAGVLQDESEWVRRNAAEALGALGGSTQPVISTLAQTLRYDQIDWVRHNAALALARIGPAARQATPALHAALDDDNYYVRTNAAIALARTTSA